VKFEDAEGRGAAEAWAAEAVAFGANTEAWAAEAVEFGANTEAWASEAVTFGANPAAVEFEFVANPAFCARCEEEEEEVEFLADAALSFLVCFTLLCDALVEFEDFDDFELTFFFRPAP